MDLFNADAVREREERTSTKRKWSKENFIRPKTTHEINISSTRQGPSRGPLRPENVREGYTYGIPTPERAVTPGRDFVWPTPVNKMVLPDVPVPRRRRKSKFLPVRDTLASQLRLPAGMTNHVGEVARPKGNGEVIGGTFRPETLVAVAEPPAVVRQPEKTAQVKRKTQNSRMDKGDPPKMTVGTDTPAVKAHAQTSGAGQDRETPQQQLTSAVVSTTPEDGEQKKGRMRTGKGSRRRHRRTRRQAQRKLMMSVLKLTKPPSVSAGSSCKCKV